MIVDLKKAKTAELEAELEMYRGTDIVVADAETLTNNASRVAEIERLIAEVGYAVRVDEAFLAEYPGLALIAEQEGAGLDIGEIVFFSKEELAKPPKEEVAQPVVSKTATPEALVVPKGTESIYLSKTVVTIQNALVHGKMYKDVSLVDGQTYRLTTEEFNRDVKSR